MLIGIIADTHDDVQRTDNAVALFKQRQVELVIHLGDWIAPFMIRRFRGFKVIGLIGNNDGDLLALRRVMDEIKGELRGDFASLDIDGKRIAAIHGTYNPVVEALSKCGLYDFVLYGHTHERDDRLEGRCRILNPGVEHVILLDTATGCIEFIEISATNSILLRARYNV